VVCSAGEEQTTATGGKVPTLQADSELSGDVGAILDVILSGEGRRMKWLKDTKALVDGFTSTLIDAGYNGHGIREQVLLEEAVCKIGALGLNPDVLKDPELLAMVRECIKISNETNLSAEQVVSMYWRLAAIKHSPDFRRAYP
jgi:hypothetical protein